MSIADKIISLTNIRASIRNALVDKGVSAEEHNFSDFANDITAIPSGSEFSFDMGEFVLDSDVYDISGIPHDLGSTPEFVLVWTDDLTGLTNEDTQNDISVGFVWLKNLTGLQQILSGTRRCDGLSVNFTQRSEEDALFVVKPSYVDYCPDASLFTDATFALHMLSISSSWRAGITYKYFISKAWWNTELGGDINA